ncbi:WD repeat-containing protein 64 isoform X4 [Catharus ustulatus]|uniref:WD repeat-containing protein 64 isoform X4 n=1 Tax=Catharus ustulatus TaxID=91951 RepID=UPI00140CE2E8|nr:WD repeat-containing protein 64 isoform X4 [Catharus ustulatus]XP_032909848.1 WD repeat-containing protein 64 isoform X4 [Catharus ustulatus]XP_032909849.1 WD repeat-containing protein 64 isoform X4 [Catharus ustulatus]
MMSEKKDRDKESCSALELIDFKNALEQFQNLVETMIIQKTKESSGSYTTDDDEIDFEKFHTTVRTLFGPAVKDKNVQAFFRKVMNNPDEKPEWPEIFGCFTGESHGMSSPSKESMVLLVSEKQQITHSVVKRKDVIKGLVKVPLLNFTVTASQKGVLTVFSKKMKVLATIEVEDPTWINGCDFLPNLKYIVAVTESTVILWDYKSKERQSNGFVIKPMKNCLLCVSTVTVADSLAKDTILMGDDRGYVYLLTITSDDFIMKQSKAKKESQFKVLDAESFDIPKRKLHDDWVGKIRYFPALKCFGSCSTDSINSFILDDIKRLEDHLPVKEFSVPKGVNAFTYCGKAKVIVTGGNDRILRLWNPVVNFSPVGKLFGHKHSVVEIVTNEKDQHVISLSCAKVFRVWDIQTLSPLQVFYENHGTPEEMNAFPMVFDNDRGRLFTGSDVIDIYPLANVIQDSKELPQTHEKSLNVLLYNRTFHQILSICSESILKVWDLETGSQIYQIEDAHGLNIEVTCAAIEINGVYLATGACDGTVKIWEFESGQEVKALPFVKHSNDERRVLKIVYLKADEGQHAVIVLEERGKIKIIQGDSAQTDLYVTWVLPEIVPFPQRNPVVYLSLKPSSLEMQNFFPDVRLLCNTSSMRNDKETFLSSVDIKCFDVLKVEGCRLITTGSANGEINLWDFESASVTCLHKTTEDNQGSGVNAILFLIDSVSSSRKRSSVSPTPVSSDDSAIPQQGSSLDLNEKENAESDQINTETKTAEETTSRKNSQNPEMSVQLLKAKAGQTPILASAHESSCIRLWSIQGNLMKELLPFSEHPSGPLTALCTDIFTKILLAGSKKGYIIRWNMASFLEDPRNKKNEIKEELCRRAHATEVVELFIEEEKNVVVTASIDGSVRLWHAMTGYYFGYFGQARKFELTDTSRLILPSDVSDIPAIIKEESKHMEKKVKYPLILDRDKWKSLTRSPSDLEKAEHGEAAHGFKFFKALAPEKLQSLETFEFGSKEAGAIFGFLPIYELENPIELTMPKKNKIQGFLCLGKLGATTLNPMAPQWIYNKMKSDIFCLQRIKAEKSSHKGREKDPDSIEDLSQDK